MKASREEVRDYVMEVIQSVGEEWEQTQVTEDSSIMGNLNWRSIEILYLAQSIQQRFEKQLPFQEFLKGVEAREQKDLTIRELVDFVYLNLDQSPASKEVA